ncbi:MAG: hypothetical protein E7358_01880 [Clostridiales bacterium]|nr:hypothetical protein [Clostridiales bacterium]
MINLSLEEALMKEGFIITSFKGTSMNPLFLEGRDKVYIVKKTSKLKRGDVALYKRSSGLNVLHRVYKTLGNTYVFWGDNQFQLEYGVKDEDVLGVCKGYYNGEKYISFKKSLKYKIYKAFWCKWVWLRKFLNLFRRAKNKLKRIFSNKNKKSS